jgi:hypothetical protein
MNLSLELNLILVLAALDTRRARRSASVGAIAKDCECELNTSDLSLLTSHRLPLSPTHSGLFTGVPARPVHICLLLR